MQSNGEHVSPVQTTAEVRIEPESLELRGSSSTSCAIVPTHNNMAECSWTVICSQHACELWS